MSVTETVSFTGLWGDNRPVLKSLEVLKTLLRLCFTPLECLTGREVGSNLSRYGWDIPQ